MTNHYNETINDFEFENNEFTIFIVSNDFANLRGREFFLNYLNTDSWVSTNSILQNKIDRILQWIQKNIPNMGELVEGIAKIKTNTPVGLKETILSLSKLFGNTIHMAAGGQKYETIIIEEGKISKKTLSHFVSLYKGASLRPKIIIILKDNDFSRVEEIVSEFPNGTNLKLISNSAPAIYKKVINKGANSIFDFLDFYSKQCFSTCSKTEHNVLLSEEWSSNQIISSISPSVFQIRSTFLSEHKLNAADDISFLSKQLSEAKITDTNDRLLLLAFQCMNDLFTVYCYDRGGSILDEAFDIANELDSDILRAHTYRFSHFFNCSRNRKQDLLNEAEKIFTKNNIADHAIYCNNNSIIHQFSLNEIKISDFCSLEKRAIFDTPGLALMAHIINNVGVAYLFDMSPEKAAEEFAKGLEYVNDNHIQKLALKSNLMIANYFIPQRFEETDAIAILNEIFYSSHLGLKRMTFLTAQFALNVIACALKCNATCYDYLLNQYKIVDLIQNAFNTNEMGTGSMIAQMKSLDRKFRKFDLLDKIILPHKTTTVSGIRAEFIERHALNPFFFNTWL